MLTWWAVGTWAVTAVGGLAMAVLFLRHNGMSQSEREGIGPLRVFPHVGLAVIGFVLWIIYAITDNDTTGWLATAAIGGAFLIAGTFLLIDLISNPALAGPALYLAGLLGATAGFHVYNVYPASIFMGDTGSL